MLGVFAFLFLGFAPAPVKPPAHPRCDSAALQEQAMLSLNLGMPTAALASYEQATKCDPSDELYERIALVACQLSSRQPHDEVYLAKAKRYVERVPAARRARVMRTCLPGCAGPGVEWTRSD